MKQGLLMVGAAPTSAAMVVNFVFDVAENVVAAITKSVVIHGRASRYPDEIM